MNKMYSIGKFQFDSYDKYKEALDDVEKIKYISQKMDINERGVAERLYTLIREGKISFKSAIGEDYLFYLSDMMIEDYKEMSYAPLGPQIVAKLKQLPWRQVIGAVCMAGAVVCFLVVLGTEFRNQQKIREVERLKSEQEISAVSEWISDKFVEGLQENDGEAVLAAETEMVENEIHSINLMPEAQAEPEVPQILPEYENIHTLNPELVGWITIEGTEIDYPVMQSSIEDSDFYLKHNFDREEDINGSIFLDARNNYLNQDDNLIIYGHNMKSGLMFGGLKKYLDETYWREHKIITFNTIYEKAQYEIVAVCLSKVSYQDEEGFRYYDFLNVPDEETFQNYITNIQDLNVMDENMEVSFGDKLLTLSTCNSYTEDGRMFLIAKKCSVQ